METIKMMKNVFWAMFIGLITATLIFSISGCSLKIAKLEFRTMLAPKTHDKEIKKGGDTTTITSQSMSSEEMGKIESNDSKIKSGDNK